jgi:hypothetical protein
MTVIQAANSLPYTRILSIITAIFGVLIFLLIPGIALTRRSDQVHVQVIGMPLICLAITTRPTPGCSMAMWKHFIILFGGFYDPGITSKSAPLYVSPVDRQ